MMTSQDALREMRWCQQWPAAQGWASAIEAAMREKDAEIERLNQMLRETGYGQGQIDAYVAQCEDLDRLREALMRCAKYDYFHHMHPEDRGFVEDALETSAGDGRVRNGR